MENKKIILSSSSGGGNNEPHRIERLEKVLKMFNAEIECKSSFLKFSSLHDHKGC